MGFTTAINSSRLAMQVLNSHFAISILKGAKHVASVRAREIPSLGHRHHCPPPRVPSASLLPDWYLSLRSEVHLEALVQVVWETQQLLAL